MKRAYFQSEQAAARVFEILMVARKRPLIAFYKTGYQVSWEE